MDAVFVRGTVMRPSALLGAGRQPCLVRSSMGVALLFAASAVRGETPLRARARFGLGRYAERSKGRIL